MQVAFWSNVHGQTTTTSNTIALTCAIALEYRVKLLLTHNHYERSTLEGAFMEMSRQQLMELEETGIDALSRFIKFNNLDKERILDYTTTLLKNRLDLLMGTRNANRDIYFQDLDNVIETILNNAKDYYDFLFVDVAAGDNALSQKILSYSDIVVVNLNQNKAVLDEFFSENYEAIRKKSIYLISLYDENSRYHLRNIKRRYKIDRPIGVVPYCRAFADACNEGKAIDFFMRNMGVTTSDPYYGFIQEVKRCAKLVLQEAGMDIENKKSGE